MKIKVDLHVHSKYSEHPSQWLLQRLGTKESYTEPIHIYETAKKNGMTYITITDHNKIDGVRLLKEKYPDEVFMGVEATTYFPDDMCKIHILIYDFTEEQFRIIDEKRKNIYDLREYLYKENLPHSVAHATFSINDKLKFEHLEKLILMFDVFEIINGGRAYKNNKIWQDVLENLTPDHISRLKEKHKIEPYSKNPWVKGYTGGSDDHSGLFIAKTFTHADGDSISDFLNNIKEKKTKADGRHNEYYSLAFSIYKIAYDFSRNNSNSSTAKSFLDNINSLIFEKNSFKNFLMVKSLKSKYKKRNEKTKELLLKIVDDFVKNKDIPIEDRVDTIYEHISDLSDQYFAATLDSLVSDFRKTDIITIFQKISSSFIGIVLTMPFISMLKVMFNDRDLLDRLENEFIPQQKKKQKKILWFTDTIKDVNGVSVTLKKIGWLSYNKNLGIRIVSSLHKEDIDDEFPPTYLNLPYFFEYTPDFYDQYNLRFPSILKSLKIIYEENPDEIYISSPGAIGIMGLIAARLLKIKAISIFHTDFTMEFSKILDENAPLSLIESYVRGFYNLTDKILVPTREYIKILEDRNYDVSKLDMFRRGIDIYEYNYKENGKKIIEDLFDVKSDSIILSYSGRISKDKNLDFLVKLLDKISKYISNVILIFAGEGPYYKEFKKECKDYKNIIFTGRLKQKLLPFLYSATDIFMFPSTTDTFGMAVLEAQSCGTPVIVSDIGGPKEIIIDNETGFVLKSGDLNEWYEKTMYIINLIKKDKKRYLQIREKARNMVIEKYDWDKIIENIVKS